MMDRPHILEFNCLVCGYDISSLSDSAYGHCTELHDHVSSCIVEAERYTCPACEADLLHGFATPKEAIRHVIDCYKTASDSATTTDTSREGESEEVFSEIQSEDGDCLESPSSLSSPSVVAGASICARCGTNLAGLDTIVRIDHFNACWSRINTESFCSEGSLMNNVAPPLPSRSPAEPSPSPTLSPITLPVSSCVYCANDLSNHSTIYALHHRITCFLSSRTFSCPICHQPLGSYTNDDLRYSMLHLQKCQNGTADSYSFIEQDDFEALYASWCGMTELLTRLRAKIEGVSTGYNNFSEDRLWKKRESPNLRYECGPSPLRLVENIESEEEVTIESSTTNDTENALLEPENTASLEDATVCTPKCPFCPEILEGMLSIDITAHLQSCLINTQPSKCPECSIDFGSFNCRYDKTAHLNDCCTPTLALAKPPNVPDITFTPPNSKPQNELNKPKCDDKSKLRPPSKNRYGRVKIETSYKWIPRSVKVAEDQAQKDRRQRRKDRKVAEKIEKVGHGQAKEIAQAPTPSKNNSEKTTLKEDPQSECNVATSKIESGTRTPSINFFCPSELEDDECDDANTAEIPISTPLGQTVINVKEYCNERHQEESCEVPTKIVPSPAGLSFGTAPLNVTNSGPTDPQSDHGGTPSPLSRPSSRSSTVWDLESTTSSATEYSPPATPRCIPASLCKPPEPRLALNFLNACMLDDVDDPVQLVAQQSPLTCYATFPPQQDQIAVKPCGIRFTCEDECIEPVSTVTDPALRLPPCALHEPDAAINLAPPSSQMPHCTTFPAAGRLSAEAVGLNFTCEIEISSDDASPPASPRSSALAATRRTIYPPAPTSSSPADRHPSITFTCPDELHPRLPPVHIPAAGLNFLNPCLLSLPYTSPATVLLGSHIPHHPLATHKPGQLGAERYGIIFTCCEESPEEAT